MARKVLNSPAYVKPCVVDVAHKLLGSDNWVFLDGKAHVEYRKGLNSIFTRKQLELYLPGQEEIYNRYFQKFVNVTVPGLTHVFVLVGVSQLIASFQIFGQVYIMTRGGPGTSTRVLIQHIYETGFQDYQLGYAAAV